MFRRSRAIIAAVRFTMLGLHVVMIDVFISSHSIHEAKHWFGSVSHPHPFLAQNILSSSYRTYTSATHHYRQKKEKRETPVKNNRTPAEETKKERKKERKGHVA